MSSRQPAVGSRQSSVGGPRVLFRVAAGPGIGFGHLVRCRSLARAMGVVPRVSVRGGAVTRRSASAMGWSVTSSAGTRVLTAERPDVVVVDDPSASHAAIWVRTARRAGLPVATIHDIGLGRVASDLSVDGSVLDRRRSAVGSRRRGLSRGLGRQSRLKLPPADLSGPSHMILDPGVLEIRERQIKPPALHVLIALGGGAHVYALAARLARAIAARVPGVRIRAASGFAAPRRQPRLERGQWVSAPDGLARELAHATVAILGGGVTLYEACALGVPAVALAVTPAQSLTIRGIARHGAVVDPCGGRPTCRPGRTRRSTPTSDAAIERVAANVARLLRDARARRRLSSAGRSLVDGQGAFRVAAAIHALCSATATAAETETETETATATATATATETETETATETAAADRRGTPYAA